jgi:hypothetical protein
VWENWRKTSGKSLASRENEKQLGSNARLIHSRLIPARAAAATWFPCRHSRTGTSRGGYG